MRGYPSLDPECSAGRNVAELKDTLSKLAESTSRSLEVIPAVHEAYVFIGNPGRQVDLAWLHDDEVSSLSDLLAEHGFTREEIDDLNRCILDLYEHHAKDDRYSVNVDDRTLIVTPSNSLKLEMHDIIERVIHH